MESMQNRIDDDKLTASNGLIKLQTAIHAQLKEQQVHTELIAKEQLTSMADVKNRIDEHKEFTISRLDKVNITLDGRISDATHKTRSLERENKAALASLQTCIDGLEAKQVNTVAGVRS